MEKVGQRKERREKRERKERGKGETIERVRSVESMGKVRSVESLGVWREYRERREGQVGQSKTFHQTDMENSWKVGQLGGEKEKGEREERRGRTIGGSREKSERKEKVRRRVLNKSLDMLNTVDRSIDLSTSRPFGTRIVQLFLFNFIKLERSISKSYPTLFRIRRFYTAEVSYGSEI